ncbi:hypothetical protein AAG570_014072 [Ranatra chinensis]|uniref:Uncharacterized protein n=1 Tax=Ranatra chinensis TaxID=642074 RepID=A0ABD0Y7E9_9HEMI
MAPKRRNMIYKNKKQETTEIAELHRQLVETYEPLVRVFTSRLGRSKKMALTLGATVYGVCLMGQLLSVGFMANGATIDDVLRDPYTARVSQNLLWMAYCYPSSLALALSDFHLRQTKRILMGLYGKFRRFGGSMMQQHQEAHTVRFPITNGSLFTTLEGRGCLLRQHNYRRVPPGMFLNLHHHQAQPPQPGGGHHYHSGHPVHQGVVQQGHRHQEVAAGPPLTSVDQLRALLGVAEDGPEEGGHYATLTSLMSACSATTAANDDFEFFHQMSPSTNQNPSHHKEQASCRENGDQVNRERRILDDNKISFRESSVGDIPKERAWRRSLESDGPGRLMPVLSVDSLAAALSKPGVSYLDTGDICTHRSDSVPDLKRIFLTDYL